MKWENLMLFYPDFLKGESFLTGFFLSEFHCIMNYCVVMENLYSELCCCRMLMLSW
jgi:hypothetical protein